MNRQGHVDFGAPSGGITTSDIHRGLGMHRKTCGWGEGGGQKRTREDQQRFDQRRAAGPINPEPGQKRPTAAAQAGRYFSPKRNKQAPALVSCGSGSGPQGEGKLTINETFCTFICSKHASRPQRGLQTLPLLIYICMTS